MSIFSDLFHSAKDEIIDLYFILSDLIEIELSEEEMAESAYFDSMAMETIEKNKGKKSRIPTGKRVI